ncbi:cupin-like domain-containing protein [Aureococcus anophagefferens]|nr:cupin-like domain-containing protein [Aureococcus anophagefferens]
MWRGSEGLLVALVLLVTAVAEDCADSTSFFYKKKAKKTCAYASEKPDSRCKSKLVDDEGVSVLQACPATCGSCSVAACEDSTSWYYKKERKNCEYVAKSADRCEKEDDFGVSGSDACPVACETCATPPPTSIECADSTSFFYKKKSKKTCGYVSEKPDNRCKLKLVDDDGVSVLQACPATCGSCAFSPTSIAPTAKPTPAPVAADACLDSTTWYYDGKERKNCEYVAKATADRCEKEDDSGTSALEMCPVTCGTCVSMWPTAKPTSIAPTAKPTSIAPTAKPTPAPVAADACLDSTTWYYDGKERKNCARKATADRCEKEDDSGTSALEMSDIAPTAKPTPAPVAADACLDSTTWYYDGKERKNCEYVAKATADRCEKKDDSGTSALEMCPVTCGTCVSMWPTAKPTTMAPTAKPTSIAPTFEPTPGPVSSCEDSMTWYYDGKERKNCEYVAKATADRCEKEDETGTSALDACPVTCGTCVSMWPTAKPTSIAPTAKPTSIAPTFEPTPGPVGSCEDSATWYYDGKERKNCEYVAKATADRCEKEDESGTSASEMCPVTCGTCVSLWPTAKPTSIAPTAKPTPGPVAACEDSASWYYAGKERKNCEYVAKATADRCEKEDESGTSATEACPVTCDTCPEQPN